MGSRDVVQTVGALYDVLFRRTVTIPNGGASAFNVLNASDLMQPGATDFVVLGPGSQVWVMSYAVRLFVPAGAPTLPLQFFCQLDGSFDKQIPFIFNTVERFSLPVYAGIAYDYTGRFRLEHPAASVSFLNSSGVAVEADIQIWGKES